MLIGYLIQSMTAGRSTVPTPRPAVFVSMDCFHLLGLVVILGLSLAFLIRHFEIGAAAGHWYWSFGVTNSKLRIEQKKELNNPTWSYRNERKT